MTRPAPESRSRKATLQSLRFERPPSGGLVFDVHGWTECLQCRSNCRHVMDGRNAWSSGAPGARGHFPHPGGSELQEQLPACPSERRAAGTKRIAPSGAPANAANCKSADASATSFLFVGAAAAAMLSQPERTASRLRRSRRSVSRSRLQRSYPACEFAMRSSRRKFSACCWACHATSCAGSISGWSSSALSLRFHQVE